MTQSVHTSKCPVWLQHVGKVVNTFQGVSGPQPKSFTACLSPNRVIVTTGVKLTLQRINMSLIAGHQTFFSFLHLAVCVPEDWNGENCCLLHHRSASPKHTLFPRTYWWQSGELLSKNLFSVIGKRQQKLIKEQFGLERQGRSDEVCVHLCPWSQALLQSWFSFDHQIWAGGEH